MLEHVVVAESQVLDRDRQLDLFCNWIGDRPIFLQALPSAAWRIERAGTAEFLDAVRILEGKGGNGVFFGINPISANTDGVPSNDNIERRAFLFLDVDHLDHDLSVPATDSGKQASLHVLDRVIAHLTSKGWPAPTKLDSGNGHHAFWRVNLPNDEATRKLCASVLSVLREKFGPLVDASVSDPRRLGRLPGTWNRKGESTQERPHRPCMFLDIPDLASVVTTGMIQSLIAGTEQDHAHDVDFDSNGYKTIGVRPGDDYNQRATWSEILEPAGWRIARQRDKVIHWTRPGKADGVSATTGYCKARGSGDLLYVFSNNAAPFEAAQSYSKFTAFTLLNFAGDYGPAAKALKARGFGGRCTDSEGSSDTKTRDSVDKRPIILAKPASSYAPAPVEWLWPGRIPRGALTILDGDPGLGKSTIATDIAARVSRGLVMPHRSGEQVGQPADVMILSAEDDPARTIRPRLDAAGADLDRVHLVEAVAIGDGDRLPILPLDLVALGDFVMEKRVGLIIVDPFMAYLGDGIESHKDQSIRRALREFSKLAQVTQCAFLVVRHLNKLAGGTAIYRGGGSIGIIGAARSGLLLAQHPEDSNLRVLASVKSNLGPPPRSITVSLQSVGAVAVASWGDEIDLSADELLGRLTSTRPKLDACNATISELLANGPMKSTNLEDRLKVCGFRSATIRRARKDLEVHSFKSSMDGEWWVKLKSPNEGAQNDEHKAT